MSEDDWLPIQYFDFWDFPRSFAVEYQGKLYLFDSYYDDVTNDYTQVFTVYQLPIELPHRLNSVERTQLENISREHLVHSSVEVGRILASQIHFDQSRRRFIHSAAFHELGIE